jgi:hypothetical protein
MSVLGSWLCENANTPEGDRRSYSSKTVSSLKLASILNSDNELKNVILAAFRSFAFLHSQGHFQTSRCVRLRSVLPLTTDIRRLRQHVRKVP